MAVPEQTPYIEHTGNGITTSFALKFQCESKDHLIVLIDDIEPPIETWSLTEGNVVFTTAPAAGKKITLQRNTPFSRTTDYQSFNNSFRPQTVNGDFDRLWLKLQELGVANWLMKQYVDKKDDELKAYLMEEIRKQGVALDQLDEYYDYLMERLAQIAVDKGWSADFVVDGDKNQHQINEEQKAQNNSFKSMLRKTPRDFGAKGSGNDDTQAVIDCISTGYFLIDAEYTVKPFLIQDLKLDGEFSRDGKLKVIDAQGRDSVEFRKCSGLIDVFKIEEVNTTGVFATLLANQCKNFDINFLRVDGGKIMTVVFKDCDNSNVNVGVGVGTTGQQGWYLVGCHKSEFKVCHLDSAYASGFYIIGSGYKSGTNHMTTRPILETTGMRTRWCSSNARTLGFDINGAVGAGFYDCDTNQDGLSDTASGFQVKQSTNIPAETKRLTYNNEIVNCTSRNCARGFNTQNGQDVVMRNITAVNCKNDAVILNDTPRVTIDGLTVIDFAQKNNTAKSSAPDQISSVVNFTNSTGCTAKGIRITQNTPVEDATKARIFNSEGSNNAISDVRVSTSGAVDAAGVQFTTFARTTGLHFNFGQDLKVGSAALYSNIIDDQTSSAIYPLVFSKQIDLTTASTGTEYFDDIPERGFICGKVRFSVIGIPANTKIAVGSQSSVAGVLGLTDVATGVTNHNPIGQVVAQSLALAIRREMSGAGAGRLFVQMRGISLF